MTTEHTHDTDCTVNPETNTCDACGVEHGEPCPECGGCAFHTSNCSEVR